MQEELKTAPFGAVWDYYCATHNVPVAGEWLAVIKKYESGVLALRG
jgi:L-rhamnose isomerase